MIYCFHISHWPNGLCHLGDDTCEKKSWEVNNRYLWSHQIQDALGHNAYSCMTYSLSFLTHYGWSQDISPRQPYKCVSYEMSHEANHIYFSCLIPVRIVFWVATCCCNNHSNETRLMLWRLHMSHQPNGLCRLGDDECEEIAREVNYTYLWSHQIQDVLRHNAYCYMTYSLFL